MKAQILFAVLIFAATPLFAQEPALWNATPIDGFASVPGAATPEQSIALAMASAPQGVAAPTTAPPVVVGPDGTAISTQYPPATIAPPGAAAGGCSSCSPYGASVAAPFAAPYPAPYPMAAPGVPQGGLIEPGMCEPVFPYKALTPDVTMVPAPANGPMPDRFGWVQLYDVGYLPWSGARDNWGHFSVFEFDAAWKYTTPLYPSPAILSVTPQYDLRLWSGPQSPSYLPPPPVNLPGAVHRIGLDVELKTAAPGPLNAVVAFNPSIDSDFEHHLTSNAWNWDGRAAFLYSPQRDLTFVLGALFWDRVHERVLPWAGMIWRPNPYWQFDLVFPQFRVSTYLWDEFGFKTSLYARIEYHSEAYEIFNEQADMHDRVEINDWRALIGFDKDRGDVAYFLEGGWVFGRDIHFKYASAGGVDLNSGGIVRAGIRF